MHTDTTEGTGPTPKGGFGRRVARILARGVLPLVVAAGGVAGAIQIYRTAPEAHRVKPASVATLVEVKAAQRSDERVIVRAMGTVVAARTVTLQPRVSGEIIELNDAFMPGGLLNTGDPILRIDPRDYELALEQSDSLVADARYGVKMELGHQEIAKREWSLLGAERDASELDRELALRKPHLEKANAALTAALAARKKAELDLQYTTIRAPFNSIVTTKGVDLGARVSTQTQLATLIGTDEYWVQVSIPVDRLKWIALPRGETEVGAGVRIHQSIGDAAHAEWAGRVVRLLGDLEPVGRMARLLVEVEDPLGLQSPDQPRPPLLIGSYVNVEIEGAALHDVTVIPRNALRDADRVWLVGEDNRLVVHQVEVVWRNRDQVFVRGIGEGAPLIVSALATPVEGMTLRVESAEDAPATTELEAEG